MTYSAMHSRALRDLLSAAVNAARNAGQAILEVYGTEFSIDYKEDRSPLTLADRRAHEAIALGLSASWVGSKIPVLSEEGKEIPYAERSKWEPFWLVDPLDGTKEFIKRNGEFTVNIALVSGQRPVLGVIFAPVKDLLYFAAEGLGAFVLHDTNGAGEVTDIDVALGRSGRLPHDHAPRPFTVVGSRSHMSPETEVYIRDLGKEHGEIRTVSAGSSLKFCLIAEGKADIYPRFAPTMEWDTAAGQVIVEQAGGSVVRPDTGRPLGYNKEDLRNPWFIASGKRDGADDEKRLRPN